MQVAQAVANSPLGSVTKSFFDAATVALTLNPAGYGEPGAYAFLVTALLAHFIFYIIENNTGAQKWSAQFREAVYETRVFLQVTIVTQFVYWGSFYLGLVYSRAQGSFYQTVIGISPFISLLTVLHIVNKICQLLTGRAGVNPGAKWPFSTPDYKPPMSTTLVPVLAGEFVNSDSVLSETKLKALYIVTYWIQNVLEITLANVPSGFMLGYAAGLAFRR